MRRIGSGLIVAAITIGTFADRPRPREEITLGAYRVLAADFHTHSSTWSDSALTPFGMVIEARYQGLDAIAITGHRQTRDAKSGRWFSETIGGPIVFVGEEIPEIPHHVIAVGIQTTVDWDLPVSAQVEEIHRQGGIAIAAHPGRFYWPGFAPVMNRLDGTEVCHPATFDYPQFGPELEEFNRLTGAAAIGSSDFHGPGRLGMCRTFVFVRDATAEGILEAVRAKRTVVYGRDDKVYGDPELVKIAEADGRLRKVASTDYPMSLLDRVSQVLGIAGFTLCIRRYIHYNHFERLKPAYSPRHATTIDTSAM
jgi:predicted metal-dependent phosphoesterase TrpH